MRYIVLCICFVAATAHAADNREEAKRHFEAAQKALDADNPRLAAQEYEASYELFPSPALLWNLAQAYRKFDQKKALHDYRLYIETAQPGTKAGRYLKDAKKLADELENVVGAEEKAKLSPPDGVVSHSDAEREAAPPPSTAAPPPPTTPSAAQAPAQAQGLPTTTTRDWYRSGPAVAGFSLVGLAVVSTSVAVGLLIHGDALDGQVSSAPSIPQGEAIANSRDSFRNGSYAMFAVAGASAIAGAALLGIAGSRPRRRQTSFAVIPAPGGIVLGVGGSL